MKAKEAFMSEREVSLFDRRLFLRGADGVFTCVRDIKLEKT